MRERTSRGCEVSGERRPSCMLVGIREGQTGPGHARQLGYASIVFEGTQANMRYMGTTAAPQLHHSRSYGWRTWIGHPRIVLKID